MKPYRASAFFEAVPVGHRTQLTLLRLSVRDHFLRAAADIHCNGWSDRAAAEWLHKKLSRYAASAWQRDRAENLCPPRLAGRVEALLWCVLKVHDAIPGDRSVRAALARAKSEVQGGAER